MNLKQPLSNKELEGAVLGLLIMSKDAPAVVMHRLFDELFYLDANKAVYRAIRSLYDNGATIDYLTVWDQIKKNGDDKLVDGPYYLTKLEAGVINETYVDTHINILSELFIKRSLGRITSEINAKCYDNGVDAFELVNEAARGLETATDMVLGGMSKNITHYVMEMLKQHAAVKNTGVLGIKTSLFAIDSNIGGLVSPDLIVLAARPGMGKTALALTITLNTTILGDIPCAWFSLEMDGIQLVRRLISMVTGIDHKRIRDGKTDDDEDAELHRWAGIIGEKKLFIEDTPNVSIRDIRTKAHLLHKKHGIKYMVVDYLQLMSGDDDRNKNREQTVSEISRGLKVLAKELQIPIIALSQLNRAVETRGDKMPSLSDLRESGAIEQDADEVMFLMRPSVYGVIENVEIKGQLYNPADLCVLKIDKNRHGEVTTSALRFSGPNMKFLNQ